MNECGAWKQFAWFKNPDTTQRVDKELWEWYIKISEEAKQAIQSQPFKYWIKE